MGYVRARSVSGAKTHVRHKKALRLSSYSARQSASYL